MFFFSLFTLLSLLSCPNNKPVWPTGGPPSTAWIPPRLFRSSSPVRPASLWLPPEQSGTSAVHPERRNEADYYNQGFQKNVLISNLEIEPRVNELK